MNKLLFLHARNRLACKWTPTGDPKTPLACLWTASKTPASADAASSTHETGRMQPCAYSIFDSALYRILEAKWLFPQEKPPLHALQNANF